MLSNDLFLELVHKGTGPMKCNWVTNESAQIMSIPRQARIFCTYFRPPSKSPQRLESNDRAIIETVGTPRARIIQ